MAEHRVRVPEIAAEMPLGPRELRHLRVLRLAEGDQVQVFDGAGRQAQAVVDHLDEMAGLLRLREEETAEDREPPQPITLAVALLKGDKLAEVVRAATELGVARVQLLMTRHADADHIGAAKLERLRRIAEEAARQSRRTVVPDLVPPMPLEQLERAGQGFVAHPGSAARLTDALRWDAPIILVSGPEGGFADAELEGLQGRGFTAVTLGPRILRAQTAPVALLGAIAALGY